MTVATTNAATEPVQGDGATTEFAFNFAFFDKAHVKLFLADEDGIEDEVAINETAVTAPSPTGGTVTAPFPPSDEQFVIIRRRVPLVQEAAIQAFGGWFPATHERALDKLTMMVQQLADAVEALPSPNEVAELYRQLEGGS